MKFLSLLLILTFTGTQPVVSPKAPFSSLTPANTIVQDTVLSHARTVRLTDLTTGCLAGEAAETSWSGGSNDVATNENGTLIQVKCTGGVSRVVGFNPKTLQGWTKISDNTCVGPNAFSRVSANVWYCQPQSGHPTPLGKANGTTVYKITFVNSGTACGLSVCPDPTKPAVWTTFLDFGTCPVAPKGLPLSYSILGVGTGDGVLSSNMSWTGGQGTSHLYFNYRPGKGCETVDTQGPTWYSIPGSVNKVLDGFTGKPLSAKWTIHDSYTNGLFAQISVADCTGCGTHGGPMLWKVGTPYVFMMDATLYASGHNTLSGKYFYNTTNPDVWQTPLSNLDIPKKIAVLTPPCCTDNHIVADVKVETNPVLGTSTGINGEVYGIHPDTGVIDRWAKTFSSGNCSATNFWACNAIGIAAQNRAFFCFTSDMQGQLGTYLDSGKTLNRSDVFCIGLIGQ